MDGRQSPKLQQEGTLLNASGRQVVDKRSTRHTSAGPSRLVSVGPSDATSNQQTSRFAKAGTCKGPGDASLQEEICEAGFIKSLRGIGKEILNDVREELRVTMSALRQEVVDMEAYVDTRETTISAMLTQVLGKVSKMQRDMELGGVHSLIGGGEGIPADATDSGVAAMLSEVNKDIMKGIEGRLDTVVSQVLDELRVVRRQQEQAEHMMLQTLQEEIRKLQLGADVEQLARRSEFQLTQVIHLQQSMVKDFQEVPAAVNKILLENDKGKDLGPMLEFIMTKFLRDNSVNVDFSNINTLMTKSFQNCHHEFVSVLNEVGKVQQALNVDFAAVFDDIAEMKKAPVKAVEDQTPVVVAPRLRKRLREFFTQTEGGEFAEIGCQTTDAGLADLSKVKQDAKRAGALAGHKTAKRRSSFTTRLQGNKEDKKKETKQVAVFADPEVLKQKVRKAAMAPPKSVADYYYTEGWAQALARHGIFENFTFMVILANSIWIAIDTDLNPEPVLVNADIVFQVAENAFCLYFTFEVVIRFLAFRKKKYCLRDGWFIFDSALVGIMIVETWVISIVFLAIGGTASVNMGDALLLRMVRIVRLMRISRMARILRAVPELVVLIKGLGAAARSVCVFGLLWLIIIYVFAVLFRQTTDGMLIGEKYFSSVPEAMNSLLLDAMLPENAALVHDVAAEHALFWPIIMIFITLASVTLMYMLIGVLVEVVGCIACTEREGMTVTAVTMGLRDVLNSIGQASEATMSKLEFQRLLVDPAIASYVQSIGVDAVSVLESADVIFEETLEKEGRDMTFEEFVDLVLNMRGTNQATVKDIKQQVRHLQLSIGNQLTQVFAQVQCNLDKVRAELMEIRTIQDSKLKEDGEDEDEDEGSADGGFASIIS